MESMRHYVVRRASEEKRYRKVAVEAGLGEGAYEWMLKLAHNEIKNPGVSRIEKLYHYFKMLESKRRR